MFWHYFVFEQKAQGASRNVRLSFYKQLGIILSLYLIVPAIKKPLQVVLKVHAM